MHSIGHILCMGHTVEYSMSCFNLLRLLNQAITTYMKYMSPICLLAVTFWCEEVSKFRVEIRFCGTSQDPSHTLITQPLASEWTLICHTTMRRNTINCLYSPGHMNLWCLEVVPVVYAKIARHSDIFNLGNILLKMMQYACVVDRLVWQSVMKINMSNSHFNLLE